MVLLDFGTGLRRGELSGLKWSDIDVEEKCLTPSRSIVPQRVGDVKTEASGKTIPLDGTLIYVVALEGRDALRRGQRLCLCKLEEEVQAALLDVENHAGLYQACCSETWHSVKGLAHSSPQLHDIAQARTGMTRSRSRLAQACLVSDHSEHIRFSGFG